MLTFPQCQSAVCPPDKKCLRLYDGGGLYLEVLQSGGKYWRMKYKIGTKEKRLSIGVFPGVTLAQARLGRDKAKQMIAGGKDPALDKQEKRLLSTLASENSFQAVALRWFEGWKPNKSPDHVKTILKRLEADVFPHIGRMPMSEITAPLLITVINKIASRDALDVAKRAYQTCGQVFEYAVAHGVCARNPVKDVRPSVFLKSRDEINFARVEAKELPELLRKIDRYGIDQKGSEITRLALQLMAYVFVRTSELIGAKWDEVDLEAKEWRIPAERMKMKTPHIVLLSDQALAIFKRLHEISGGRELVFPSVSSPKKSMSNNTLLFALYRMGYHSRMTGHGFRGIASTILHEQGYQHEHIETQLAHAERNRVSASYNHARYLPQRRVMLQDWANYLDAIKQGAEVIPLHAKAKR